MISLMINDPQIARELIAERQARQLDRYDEVWDDVYVMSPIANNEHQSLVTELSAAILTVVDWRKLGQTLTGANVTDRQDDWTRNYRIPDVLVFKNDTTAVDCDTHWFGGPEFVIEILSPGDRTLEKLNFFAEVGTRELLIIDRDPWQLTLYRLNENHQLAPVAISRFDQVIPIELQQFPLSFCFHAQSSSLNVMRDGGVLVREIAIKLR